MHRSFVSKRNGNGQGLLMILQANMGNRVF